MASYVVEVWDYLVGEFGYSKDVVSVERDLGVSSDFVAKNVVSSLRDLSVGLDFVAKDLLSLAYDDVLTVDWALKDVGFNVYDLGVSSDYLRRVVVSNIFEVGHVLDWIYLPTMKIVIVMDSLFPDFAMMKSVIKKEIDFALSVDLKLVKDVVRCFADGVVGFDRAIRTKIVEVFDRVFHEFDISKEMSKMALDRLVPADVVAKIAYKLMGYDVRRVYSIPRPLADIIESADHNTKMLVCQALIAAVKSLKDKLSE